MIDLLLDTILPADPDLNMPSAASLGLSEVVVGMATPAPLEEYTALLDQLADEIFGGNFASLDAEDRLQIVEKSKRKNNRLANTIILHCLKAYYTNETILKTLPAGAVPPFPEGNIMGEDDWSLLEPVYERGRIYRSV